jgi:multicomponent Na+:H+ antiporter subunit D
MALKPESLDPTAIFVAAGAGDWLVVLPLVICLSAGASLVMLRSRLSAQPLLAIMALGLLVLVDAALLMRVAAEGPQTMVMGRWLPPFGIAFSVDLTGAILNLGAALVALAAAFHSLSDVDAGSRRYGFYPFLMLLMAGVSGAFLTGDIFNLYVWFEVLLISSFGLLVLGGRRAQLDGAIKYGLLNLVATTLFLIATGYLYAIFGTLNMADITIKARTMADSAPLVTLASLYLMAFGMKAAAFPLNFWLPASYHTPSITVSALFSGVLTKVGIYALLRTLVMIFPAARSDLAPLIGAIAIATMMFGALGALGQQDIRRLVGQLVISGIGLMLAGLALSTEKALGATLFYALHSMAVMAGLFVMAGLAGKAGGSFSLHRLSGLWLSSPLFSALTLVLVLSVSSLPPFSGFWPKAVLVGEALDAGRGWLAAAILASGFITTLATGRMFLLVFWRSIEGETPPQPIRTATLLPLAALCLPLVALGLWPEPVLALANQAAGGLLDPAPYLQSVFGGGKLQ